MPKLGENWRCPFCGAHQALGDARFHSEGFRIDNDDSTLGRTGLLITSIACANQECRKMTLEVELHERGDPRFGFSLAEELKRWKLLPESSARPLPDYVPEAIRTDYAQACRIRDLSPKASATLSRRCLQGMIRDFCGIRGSRLIDEIEKLESQVDQGKAPAGVQPDTLEAIDHVREIGNIGAHMEADINLIVDVDPDEAQKLIELIELLLEEWYVARHQREGKLKAIGVVAGEKKAARLKAPSKSDSGT
ncbi:MAG: DUF4145 domain-containing protein [Alphaproteobacteria bacterium]